MSLAFTEESYVAEFVFSFIFQEYFLLRWLKRRQGQIGHKNVSDKVFRWSPQAKSLRWGWKVAKTNAQILVRMPSISNSRDNSPKVNVTTSKKRPSEFNAKPKNTRLLHKFYGNQLP